MRRDHPHEVPTIPVRPVSCEVGEMDNEDFAEIVCEEQVSDEARPPEVLRDPGAPTVKELEEHNITHLPFRSWCPHCVAGKAQDRPHKTKKGAQMDKQLPEVVFDYGFFGGKEDEETLAVQVARDRRTQMIFANVVPRKGMIHEHGAQSMVDDLAKLGYQEIILKCDGEPALKNVQAEVQRRRAAQTILENSVPGDSKTNGAAERAVKAVGEQVRVLRAGLQSRLDMVIRTSHPMLTWLVQHAADCLSKYQVGEDGKTAYERLKGKKFSRPLVEFGEKVHYKKNTKGHKDNKLDIKWGEGYFLGFYWKTSEALIGTPEGVKRAGTIRRVGAHRRWDAEGLDQVRGVPWQWNPDVDEVPDKLMVRMLSEDERQRLAGPVAEAGPKTIYRMRLKRDDFISRGFTEGCPGCKSILSGGPVRNHSEVCRKRMEGAMKESGEGQARLKRQVDREHEYISRILEKHDGEENARKKPKPDHMANSEGGADEGAQQPMDVGQVPAVLGGGASSSRERSLDDSEPKRQKVDPESAENPMETNIVERLCQDDMSWHLHNVEDMCEKEDPELQRKIADYSYFDENTWEELDPKLVAKGEQEEYERFCKMGVYEYASREEAENDSMGKFVKVKWVRTKKGEGVRCRLVAQELGYGERLDELFAGTPSLGSVRMALSHAMKKSHHKIMVMDVKCAFLYGEIRRNVYIELPHTDPRYGDGTVVGKLKKAMYGTRDAPQIWSQVVQDAMEGLGYKQSAFQPAVYYHPDQDVIVVVHVDDFLATGDGQVLEVLYTELSKKFDIKRKMLSLEDDRETTYLNRTLKLSEEGVEIIGDKKHSDILLREWGLQEGSKEVSTPSLKELEDNNNAGEELHGDMATKVRRGIARVNYMAQDRPDLSAAAKAMSQHMSQPREGVLNSLKRCVRYLKRYPVSSMMIPSGVDESDNTMTVWSDSDWAGDLASRRSTSGGVVVYRGAILAHWSKSQSNVALSSAEAELNATVKGLSELIGLYNLVQETQQVSVNLVLCTDASACKGMLLRHGAGKVKHLSVKQLWAQECVKTYEIEVLKVPRDKNPSDVLTHSVSHPILDKQMEALHIRRGRG